MNILDHLIYRDAWLLILNKPAGLPVHAGPGGGDNLENYFEELRFGLKQPPFLAHRLDRDTSGCLALGRHKKALRRLGEIFSQGQAKKTYWAIVEGAPANDEGEIDAPLKKITRRDRGWRMIVAPDGQPARTLYRNCGRSADGKYSWLELRPQSGRTHQLRVHLAHLGCPILGDGHYGSIDRSARLHLHACSLELPLYSGQPPILATAPLPEHLKSIFSSCGYKEKKPI